jgi:signal transduction histidine kinase
MFNSTVLEIALGLTLMYLALSLMCSGLIEYYSALLNRRPGHLKDALFGLFDKDDPKGRLFLAQFFSHPLIKGLSTASWSGKPAAKAPTAATAVTPGTAPGPLGWSAADVQAFLESLKWTPHYIPDWTFSEVVFDILGRWSAPTGGTVAAMSPSAAVEGLIKDVADAIGKVPDELVQKDLKAEADAWSPKLRADVAAATTPQAAWDSIVAALGTIRNTAGAIADAKGRAGFLAVLDRWDAQHRTAVRDRAAGAADLRAAIAALATLRGGASALPESLVKARLRAQLDEEEAKLRDPALAGTTSAAIRDAIGTTLAAVRGAAEMLTDNASREAFLPLLRREADHLTAVGNGVLTLQKVRATVQDLPDSEFRNALRSLMDEEGEDLDRVKQNLQTWYNDTMDRVSGWYKRNTQVILFVVALIVAFGMNADTIEVANRLLQDPVLRASAAEAARGVLSRDRPQSPPGQPAPAPATAPAPAVGRMADELPGDIFAPPSGATPKTATSPPSPGTQFTDAEQADITKALDRLHLPLFWDSAEFDQLAAVVGQGKKATFTSGLSKLFGLLITALALTMGAPFWYDVLGIVVNVRAAGQKPEKTAT